MDLPSTVARICRLLPIALLLACSSPPTEARPSTTSAAQPAARDSRTFICPMCEGVRQQGPGQCPRCGMDLVPEGSAAAGPPGHEHMGHQHPGQAQAHSDHTPRHGGQLGMTGDIHVELVVRPDGRHQVFLSDALRAPIALERTREGSLVFMPSGEGASTTVPLAPDAASGALVAARPLPATGGEVSVRVQVGTERVTMDFQLAAPAANPTPNPSDPPSAAGGGALSGHEQHQHR